MARCDGHCNIVKEGGLYAAPLRPLIFGWMKAGIGNHCRSGMIVGALLGLLLLVPTTARALAAETVRLLAFGDSLVHGYGLAQGDEFPAQLQRALEAEGRAVEVLNGGNSGDTTAGGLARLDWSLAERPDAVLLELGANDALRGLEPDAAYENLEAILRRLKAVDIPVLLVGMRAPLNLGADYVSAFDDIFPSLAEKHKVFFYPFFLEGVALVPALNQADGIHPNREGVAVIVEKIMPYVIDLLDHLDAGGGQGDG